jgi:hypothetical protein
MYVILDTYLGNVSQDGMAVGKQKVNMRTFFTYGVIFRHFGKVISVSSLQN